MGVVNHPWLASLCLNLATARLENKGILSISANHFYRDFFMMHVDSIYLSRQKSWVFQGILLVHHVWKLIAKLNFLTLDFESDRVEWIIAQVFIVESKMAWEDFITYLQINAWHALLQINLVLIIFYPHAISCSKFDTCWSSDWPAICKFAFAYDLIIWLIFVTVLCK